MSTLHTGDKTPEELGAALMAAQDAIHTAPPGWPLSHALAEFSGIMQSWEQHPDGRNWKAVSDLEAMIKRIEQANAIDSNYENSPYSQWRLKCASSS